MHNAICRLLLSLFLLLTAHSAAAADLAVPPAFDKLIPRIFANGLQLVEIRQRCEGCAPWRTIRYAAGGNPAAVREMQVSVRAGVTAMYAFPGTPYFANVKVEQSLPGRYEQDKAIVIEALENEYQHRKQLTDAYMKAHPPMREKLERAVAKGKEYLELERGTHKGVEYALATENAIGLSGSSSTVSQLQIFLPQEEAIVTVYLLNQPGAKFRNIDEFIALRRAFIEGYIDYIVETKTPPGASEAASVARGAQ
jgi:hypothetical protein